MAIAVRANPTAEIDNEISLQQMHEEIRQGYHRGTISSLNGELSSRRSRQEYNLAALRWLFQ